jgi:hypothetical protein
MTPTTRYLTGADNEGVRAVAGLYPLGLLAQPNSGYSCKTIAAYPFWAADNGCFSQTTARAFEVDFDLALDEYLAWLAGRIQGCGAPIFATAPDKLDWIRDPTNGREFPVGDAKTTLERAARSLHHIRELAPAALVGQDGMESMSVPWDSFDVLFLGGSDPWKLGGCRPLVVEAQARGKQVHMGRVNSRPRFALADSWGVDTADGTYLAFGPDVNLVKLRSWLDQGRWHMPEEAS